MTLRRLAAVGTLGALGGALLWMWGAAADSISTDPMANALDGATAGAVLSVSLGLLTPMRAKNVTLRLLAWTVSSFLTFGVLAIVDWALSPGTGGVTTWVWVLLVLATAFGGTLAESHWRYVAK